MSKFSNTIEYKLRTDVDLSGINKLQASLSQVQSQLTKMKFNSGGMNNAFSGFEEASRTIKEVQSALNKSFNIKVGMTDVTKLTSSLQHANVDLKTLYKNFATAGSVGKVAFNNLLGTIGKVNVAMRTTSSLGDKVFNTIGNTVRWGLVAGAFETVRNSVYRAVEYVKDLDKSLNDIRIVSGQSAEQMRLFAKEANEAARNLGKTTTEFTNASLIFVQQGYNTQKSKQLAELTLKTANVTGQDTAAVSEQLTALINGYQMQGKSIEYVERQVDKLAKVAAVGAADLEELATGFSKVAAVANTLGVSTDQLTAQLSTIISVTREAPETVGNALKTIYSRLGDLKLGDTLDDGTTLGQISKNMEKVGVEVLDATGNMRNMGTIIEDLMKKWQTLSTAQKQGAAESLAGRHQYTRFMALLENYQMYSEQLGASLESAGTLEEQQQTYMESLAGKMNALQSAEEGIINSLFNSDDIKPTIDALTTVLDQVQKIIDTVGGAGTVWSSFAATGARVISKQLGRSFSNFMSNRDMQKIARQFNDADAKVLLKSMGLDSSINNSLSEQLLRTAMINKQNAPLMSNEQAQLRNETFQAQINKANELEQRLQAAQDDVALLNGTLQELLGTDQEVISVSSNGVIKISQEFQDLMSIIGGSGDDFAQLTKNMDFSKASMSLRDFMANLDKLSGKALIGTATPANLKASIKKVQGSDFYNFFTKKEKAQLAELGSSTEDVSERISKLNQLLGNVKDRLDKAGKSAETTATKFFEAAEALQTEADAAEQAARETKLFNDVSEQSFGIQKVATATMDLVGSLGQLASSITAMHNLGKILSDDDIDNGEKFLRIVESLAFILPMLLYSINGLSSFTSTVGEVVRTANPIGKHSAGGPLTKIDKTYKPEHAAVPVVVSSTVNEAENGKHSSGKKTKNNNKYQSQHSQSYIDTTFSTVAKESKNATKSVNGFIGSIKNLVGGFGTVKTAVSGITTVAKGLFTAIGGIPGILLTIASIAIPAVIGAVQGADEETKEAAEEAKQKAREEAEQRIESTKAAAESRQTYVELYNEYKETGIITQDLKDAMVDYAKQLGKVIRAEDIHIENIEALNKELLKETAFHAKEAYADLQTQEIEAPTVTLKNDASLAALQQLASGDGGELSFGVVIDVKDETDALDKLKEILGTDLFESLGLTERNVLLMKEYGRASKSFVALNNLNAEQIMAIEESKVIPKYDRYIYNNRDYVVTEGSVDYAHSQLPDNFFDTGYSTRLMTTLSNVSSAAKETEQTAKTVENATDTVDKAAKNVEQSNNSNTGEQSNTSTINQQTTVDANNQRPVANASSVNALDLTGLQNTIDVLNDAVSGENGIISTVNALNDSITGENGFTSTITNFNDTINGDGGLTSIVSNLNDAISGESGITFNETAFKTVDDIVGSLDNNSTVIQNNYSALLGIQGVLAGNAAALGRVQSTFDELKGSIDGMTSAIGDDGSGLTGIINSLQGIIADNTAVLTVVDSMLNGDQSPLGQANSTIEESKSAIEDSNIQSGLVIGALSSNDTVIQGIADILSNNSDIISGVSEILTNNNDAFGSVADAVKNNNSIIQGISTVLINNNEALGLISKAIDNLYSVMIADVVALGEQADVIEKYNTFASGMSKDYENLVNGATTQYNSLVTSTNGNVDTLINNVATKYSELASTLNEDRENIATTLGTVIKDNGTAIFSLGSILDNNNQMFQDVTGLVNRYNTALNETAGVIDKDTSVTGSLIQVLQETNTALENYNTTMTANGHEELQVNTDAGIDAVQVATSAKQHEDVAYNKFNNSIVEGGIIESRTSATAEAADELITQTTEQLQTTSTNLQEINLDLDDIVTDTESIAEEFGETLEQQEEITTITVDANGTMAQALEEMKNSSTSTPKYGQQEASESLSENYINRNTGYVEGAGAEVVETLVNSVDELENTVAAYAPGTSPMDKLAETVDDIEEDLEQAASQNSVVQTTRVAAEAVANGEVESWFDGVADGLHDFGDTVVDAVTGASVDKEQLATVIAQSVDTISDDNEFSEEVKEIWAQQSNETQQSSKEDESVVADAVNTTSNDVSVDGNDINVVGEGQIIINGEIANKESLTAEQALEELLLNGQTLINNNGYEFKLVAVDNDGNLVDIGSEGSNLAIQWINLANQEDFGRDVYSPGSQGFGFLSPIYTPDNKPIEELDDKWIQTFIDSRLGGFKKDWFDHNANEDSGNNLHIVIVDDENNNFGGSYAGGVAFGARRISLSSNKGEKSRTAVNYMPQNDFEGGFSNGSSGGDSGRDKVGQEAPRGSDGPAQGSSDLVTMTEDEFNSLFIEELIKTLNSNGIKTAQNVYDAYQMALLSNGFNENFNPEELPQHQRIAYRQNLSQFKNDFGVTVDEFVTAYKEVLKSVLQEQNNSSAISRQGNNDSSRAMDTETSTRTNEAVGTVSNKKDDATARPTKNPNEMPVINDVGAPVKSSLEFVYESLSEIGKAVGKYKLNGINLAALFSKDNEHELTLNEAMLVRDIYKASVNHKDEDSYTGRMYKNLYDQLKGQIGAVNEFIESETASTLDKIKTRAVAEIEETDVNKYIEAIWSDLEKAGTLEDAKMLGVYDQIPGILAQQIATNKIGGITDVNTAQKTVIMTTQQGSEILQAMEENQFGYDTNNDEDWILLYNRYLAIQKAADEAGVAFDTVIDQYTSKTDGELDYIQKAIFLDNQLLEVILTESADEEGMSSILDRIKTEAERTKQIKEWKDSAVEKRMSDDKTGMLKKEDVEKEIDDAFAWLESDDAAWMKDTDKDKIREALATDPLLNLADLVKAAHNNILDEYMKASEAERKQLLDNIDQTIEGNFAEVRSIAGNLKTGDTISEESYAKLIDDLGKESLDGYFSIMADGTYQLVGDAKEFYNAVTEASRQAMFDNISKGVDTNNVDMVRSNSEELLSTAGNLGELDALRSQVSSMISPGEGGVFGYSEALIQLASQYENCTKEIKEYQEALESNDLSTIKAAEDTLRASITIGELSKTYNLAADDVETHARLLKDSADGYELTEEQAARLAVANRRMNRGVKTLNENFEDWIKILKSGDHTTMDYADTLNDAFDALADLTGALDASTIPADFLDETLDSGAQHLEWLGQAAQGDVQAINLLGSALAVANVESMQADESFTNVLTGWKNMSDDQVASTFDNLKSVVVDAMGTIHQAIQDGLSQDEMNAMLAEMGDDWILKLNAMARATGMSVDEMNSLLGQLGVQAKVDVEYVQQEMKVPTYTTYETVSEESPADEKTGKPAVWKKESYTVPGAPVTVQGYVPVAQISTDANNLTPDISYGGTGGSYSGGGISPSSLPSSSGGGGGGGGGGGDSYTPKKQKHVEEDKNLYEYVDTKLEDIQQDLSLIADEQDRLVGDKLASNINKQLKLTQKQIDYERKKLEIMQQEAATLRDRLAEEAGAVSEYDEEHEMTVSIDAIDVVPQYDEEGFLANYAEMFDAHLRRINGLIDLYNQEATEDGQERIQLMIDLAKEQFENFKSDVSRYDALIGTEMNEIRNQIEQDYDAMEDLHIEALHTAIEAVENIQKVKEAMIDFNAVFTGIDSSDPFRNASVGLQKLGLYFDRTGKSAEKFYDDLIKSARAAAEAATDEDERAAANARAETYEQARQMVALRAANGELFGKTGTGKLDYSLARAQLMSRLINEYETTGESEIYAENSAQLYEDAQEAFDELTQDWQDFESGVEDMSDSIIEMIETIGETGKQYTAYLDELNDALDQAATIIELIRGDDYDSQIKIAQDRITNDRLAIQANDYTLAKLNELIDNEKQFIEVVETSFDENGNTVTRQVEVVNPRWQAIHEQQVELQQDSSKRLQQIVENTQAIRDAQANLKLDRFMTEIGLKAIGANGNAYTVKDKNGNSLGDLEWANEQWELINRNEDQYLDDVNRAVETQKLQNKYQAMLNDSTDPGIQRQITEQMKQQLAYLREKNQLSKYDVEYANMQLDILQKRIALEEAQRNKSTLKLRRDGQGNYSYVYTADQNAIDNAENDLLDAELNAYNLAKNNSIETQGNALSALQQFREQMVSIITNNTLTAEEQTKRIQFLAQNFKDFMAGNFEQLNTSTQQAFTEAMELAQNLMDENQSNILTMIEENTNATSEQLSMIDDRFNSSITSWMTTEETFKSSVDSLVNGLVETAQEYESVIKGVGENTTNIFNSITDSIKDTETSTASLINTQKQFFDLLDEQGGITEGYINSLNEIQKQAFENSRVVNSLKETISDLEEQLNQKNLEEANIPITLGELQNPSSGAGKGTGDGSGNGEGGNGSGKGGSDTDQVNIEYSNGTIYPNDVLIEGLAGNIWYIGSWDNDPNRRQWLSERFGDEIASAVQSYINHVRAGQWEYSHDLDSMDYYRQFNIDAFDTGGYTGDWDNSGRIAMLHQKELVLNKHDTENMLEAVKTLRDMQIASAMDNSAANFFKTGIHNIQSILSGEQQVHIEASFPGVQTAIEIQNALLGLANQASHHMWEDDKRRGA